MESLDLRGTHPRRAWDEAGGVVFLPRSIDKVRATLDGGEIGEYKIEGFTTHMLDALGISLEDFTQSVHDAATDDEVAAYVKAHAKPGGIDAWNGFAKNREVYNGDRAEAIADYPWLEEHPEVKYSLDFIDYTEANNIET